jgi:hypothetical protein
MMPAVACRPTAVVMIATRVGDRRHAADDLLAWDGSVEESRDHPCAGTAESVVPFGGSLLEPGPLVPTDEPERHRCQRPSSCRQLGGRPGSSSAHWRLSRAIASKVCSRRPRRALRAALELVLQVSVASGRAPGCHAVDDVQVAWTYPGPASRSRVAVSVRPVAGPVTVAAQLPYHRRPELSGAADHQLVSVIGSRPQAGPRPPQPIAAGPRPSAAHAGRRAGPPAPSAWTGPRACP